MAEAPNLLNDLERVARAVEQLVDGVRDDQWSAPTPCDEWDVRQLVDHMATGNHRFTEMATGQPAAPPQRGEAAPDLLGDDPKAAFRANCDAMLSAFSAPGFLDRTFPTPIGEQSGSGVVWMRLHELLVHGWDLAKATGQPPDLPDDIAEQVMASSRQRLGGRPRDGSPFKPEQPAPDGARAIDRFAAYLGRPV